MPVPAAPPISPSDARITLTLNQIPLGEALRYIASQAGLKVKVEPYAISIIPINEQSSDLFTQGIPGAARFRHRQCGQCRCKSSRSPCHKSGWKCGGTGKDTQESTGGQQLVTRQTALDFLKDQGVPFPPGRAPISSRRAAG